jgi:hypothetical protein
MPKAQRYQFEQRPGGMGAVMRIGPTGGKRLINVYKDQDTAWRVKEALEAARDQEA